MKDRVNARSRRSALTLIEAMISLVIVSTVMLAVIRVAGASGRAQYLTAQRAKAHFLAGGMIAELLPLSYEDPRGGTAFGREADESPTSKIAYNDVDDYHGWSESPPQDRNGVVISGFAGWQRSVVVEWVNANDLSTVSTTETGAKRVTVSVRDNGLLLGSRVAIRTRAP